MVTRWLAARVGNALVLPLVVAGVSVPTGRALAQDAPFLRGDSNLDGVVNITDAVLVLRVLFLGDAPRGCDDALDLDDDGEVSLEDCVLGLQFLFLDGPEPPAPFGQCGLDPTPDGLWCTLHPLCDSGDSLCITQETVDLLLADLVAPAFSFCIPAGIIDLPLDPLAISMCPEDGAQPCGVTGLPGCFVEITSIMASVDIGGRRIALVIEGRVDDLPVRVTDSIFNSSTTCLTSLHGEDPALPFHLETAISLETLEVGSGVEEVIGTSSGQVENVDLALSASGGLLCALFEAGQDALLGLILSPLQSITEVVAGPLGEQLVGLRLCTGAVSD